MSSKKDQVRLKASELVLDRVVGRKVENSTEDEGESDLDAEIAEVLQEGAALTVVPDPPS